jgi:multidrug efflux pump subunit AcrA (membrane-fusion protein)
MDVVRQVRGSRRRVVWVSLAAAGIFLGLFLGAVHGARGADLPRVARASVWTEHVRRGDLVRQVPVHGTLVPERVRWLSAVTQARVARIAVRPGAPVDCDTVVIVLENAELELAQLEAERQASSAAASLVALDTRTAAEQKQQQANLAALEAEREDAERRARAAQELAAAGLLSELERGSHQTKARGLVERIAAEKARSDVLDRGRRKQLAAQREELGRLRDIAAFRRSQLAALEVRAGVRGVAQEIPLENGMWVPTGQVLAKIAETNALRAKVMVAEGNAGSVQPGLTVRFEDAFAGLRGRVERVHPAVSGGSVELDVALDDQLPLGARPDQAVTGYVEFERAQKVVVVARPANVRDGATAAVFRLDADGRHATRKGVRFGTGSLREIAVVEGLSPGDEIVISDTSAWNDSARVRLE